MENGRYNCRDEIRSAYSHHAIRHSFERAIGEDSEIERKDRELGHGDTKIVHGFSGIEPLQDVRAREGSPLEVNAHLQNWRNVVGWDGV